MPDQTVFPCIYVVSDGYPAADTGEAGGYDDSMRLLFPDLDFGAPDQQKRIPWVEVTYQSLKELPVTVTVWYRKRLGDAGDASDSTVLETEVTTANEPGVIYNTSDPEWSTAPYATLRTFSQRIPLDQVAGLSFDIGVIIDANMLPCKLLKLSIQVVSGRRGTTGTTIMGVAP